MRTSLALLAVAGTLVAAPALAAETATCATATTADVEAQFARVNAAWQTGNPDTVTALFSREPVLLATVSNTPRTDAASVRDYFVSFLKAKPVGTIDTSTVEVDCNTATRVGTWTVALTDAATGAVNNVRARYSFIYRFENGDWKIDHLHSSMMPEAAR